MDMMIVIAAILLGVAGVLSGMFAYRLGYADARRDAAGATQRMEATAKPQKQVDPWMR